ncbi:MAG: hypothetical protein RSG22_06640 [Comamonas sp.]
MSKQHSNIHRDLLEHAEPETLEVLDRIQNQRERLNGRRLAHQQALALKHQGSAGNDMVYGSVVERVISFGRQHPIVCAAAFGLGLLLGPRKLIRVATMAAPILMKFRR